MKTTIEIGDELFRDAKLYAAERDMSLKSTVEAGLRLLMSQQKPSPAPFRLKDGSYGSGGMVKDFTWPEIRAIIYEGRGGEE